MNRPRPEHFATIADFSLVCVPNTHKIMTSSKGASRSFDYVMRPDIRVDGPW